jgi:predicted amidophosphoribosyltransferase
MMDSLFCPACRSRVHFIKGGACPRCGQPGVIDPGQCRRCRNFTTGFRACFVAAQYSGVVRELVLRLKFGNDRGAAFPLACLAAPMLPGLSARHELDCAVAVPLHRSRERERGFNQAEMIAEKVALALELPLLRGVVRRCRNTRPQGTGGGGSRRVNVRGAFQPHPGSLPGLLRGEAPASLIRDRQVLLVDDVLSTGATMDACAGALMMAGARGVIGLAVAT